MSSKKCPVCAKASADGLLCDQCIGRCRRWLRTVHDLWPEMTTPSTHRSAFDGGSSTGNRSPLPVNLDAVEDSQEVRTRLVGLVRMLDMGDSEGMADWPPVWCVWLSERASRIRTHEGVVDIVAEIQLCQQIVLRRAGRGGRDDLFCGYCKICGHGLYARPGDSSVLCRECKKLGLEPTPYDVAASRNGMRSKAEDSLVTRPEAASFAGVKRQTLDMWITRGRVLLHGDRVRLGDVLDAAEGMRQRAAG